MYKGYIDEAYFFDIDYHFYVNNYYQAQLNQAIGNDRTVSCPPPACICDTA